MRMMMPPIVGTPFFCTPKGSMLLSRSVSEMLRRFMNRMKWAPNHAERRSEMTSVSRALKEM